ncbi:MAG TPA: alpha/beta hydrolase [bacterium]|nr:alpha/beta hydrolase [bacterium]
MNKRRSALWTLVFTLGLTSAAWSGEAEPAAPTTETPAAEMTQPEVPPEAPPAPPETGLTSPEGKPVLLLWPEGAPGAKGTEEKDKPALTVYLPEGNATGAAVVICPGGGYGGLAMDHEGRQVAQWLNQAGIAGLILKYRIAPDYQHPAPMQDALRAMRLARAHAEEWHIDPGKIGIMGFSAGGHLASTVGTHFDYGQPAAADPVERLSSKPNFMILVYPVITMINDYTHRGSRKNLLGENPDPALIKNLSNHLQVLAYSPPTFLVHTMNDAAVPVENSLLFYQALRYQGVPAEMHLFEQGPHGFGLAPNDPVLSHWPALCLNWLKVRQIIP